MATWSDDESALISALQSTRGALAERMGVEFVAVSRERIEATMPVDGNTQPYGVLHGGASCVLAETVASLGSALHGWPERVALGIEVNATHHRSVSEGTVRAVATPLRVGRTLATWDVRITDDADRLVCTSRVTCVLREG